MFFHPGGTIGKKLLKVEHLMHAGDELPIVQTKTVMREVVKIINEKKFGIVIVTDRSHQVQGVITDGDLRRHVLQDIDFSNTIAESCMTSPCLTIDKEKLAVEALTIMEKKRVTALVVTENGKLQGLVHLHDLWRTEMI